LEALEPQQHASDLVDFYSGGEIPARNLDLIKDRIDRKVQQQKDPELKSYVGIRETLKELRQMHTRRGYHPAIYLTFSHPVLRELLQLRPEDFLIVMASHRYSIPDEELSIILGVSGDHLRFRRNQLQELIANGKADELKKICTAPVAAINQEVQQSQQHRRNIADRFRALPLPARFLFETGFVLSVLIFLMWLIPEVRNRYESSIQKRINDYMIESTISDAPAPEGTSKTPRIVEAPPSDVSKDLAPEEPESKSTDSQNKRPLKVNTGETWRFSFTGPATNDIMSGITDTLQKMGYEDVKSVTAPGGIQFDFFVPVKDLSNLKLNLEEMTAHLQRRTSSSAPDTPAVVNMSWYKKRGMTGRKVPVGSVEVVIWVSTL
jgi:hypothetical protein